MRYIIITKITQTFNDWTITRWDSGKHCGACIKLKCSCNQSELGPVYEKACWGMNTDNNPSIEGREVTVMVTDSCPSCHGYVMV